MKAITIFFFLCSSLTLSAQDYIPMLSEFYYWQIFNWANGGITPYNSGRVCHIFGDTTVNNQTYKKIRCANLEPIDSPVFTGPFQTVLPVYDYAFMREDTAERKVYSLLYSQNTEEWREYLTYDFSLEIGDTLVVPETPDIDENGCCFFEARLDTISETTFVNGDITKAYEFSLVNYDDEKRTYIEGIGSGSLFLPFDYAFEFGTRILCVSVFGHPYWAMDLQDGYACNLGVSTNDLQSHAPINIYPNPSNGRFILESPNLIAQLRIYALDGRLVAEKRVENQNTRLEWQHQLPPGVYWLQLLSDKGISYSKIITY